MMSIIDELPKPIKGVIHCFTGNKQQAEFYVNAGLYLGFTGVITYKPKKLDPKPQEDLLEALAWVPKDRMLVETDSPFLAPQAYRGKRAEPWMVEECAKKVAEVKGMTVEDVEVVTTENGKKLFERIK